MTAEGCHGEGDECLGRAEPEGRAQPGAGRALAVIPAPITSPVGRAAELEGLTGVLRGSLVTISGERRCGQDPTGHRGGPRWRPQFRRRVDGGLLAPGSVVLDQLESGHRGELDRRRLATHRGFVVDSPDDDHRHPQHVVRSYWI